MAIYMVAWSAQYFKFEAIFGNKFSKIFKYGYIYDLFLFLQRFFPIIFQTCIQRLR